MQQLPEAHASRAHELLAQVESIAQTVVKERLEKLGIAPGDIPNTVAVAIGVHLVDTWAGQQVYFPKDIDRRNARIYDEWREGTKEADLAQRHNLSTATVYQILADERELRRVKQGTLPGFHFPAKAANYE